MKEGHYSCTHFLWDSEDRQYDIYAVWNFEKNYPDMPDYWHLISLDVMAQEPGAENIDLSLKEGGSIWQSIEDEGPTDDIQEVDYVS
tara:strand:+ start:3809 stop:4069 length:261 start_codon:yes stop_codon:yes gene_type:complete